MAIFSKNINGQLLTLLILQKKMWKQKPKYSVLKIKNVDFQTKN